MYQDNERRVHTDLRRDRNFAGTHHKKRFSSDGTLLVEAAIILPLIAALTAAFGFYVNSVVVGIKMTNAAHLVAISLKSNPGMSEAELEEVVSAALGPQPAVNGPGDKASPGVSKREARIGIKTFTTNPSHEQLSAMPVKWTDDPPGRGWKVGNPHDDSCPSGPVRPGPYWVAVTAQRGLSGFNAFGLNLGGFSITSDYDLVGRRAQGTAVVRVGSGTPAARLRIKRNKIKALDMGYNLKVRRLSREAECDNSAYFTKNKGDEVFIKRKRTTKLRFRFFGCNLPCKGKKIGLSSWRVRTLSGGPDANGFWDGSAWRVGIEDDVDEDFNDGEYEITASAVCGGRTPTDSTEQKVKWDDGFSYDNDEDEDEKLDSVEIAASNDSEEG